MASLRSPQTRSVARPRRAGLRVGLRVGLGRYLAARLAMWATRPATAPAFVLWFAILHAVLWTVILTSLKAAQDVHMDVAEAYAWGQRFLLGYGKHPPLSGWIAGVWFMAFPARDWATYALAMATIAVSLVVCWHIARRVVDARRAFVTVLMLAIYPIFNFKGFKYNPDLLQLVTLPLIVLAYLNAFQKRSAVSGFWLGLAAVAGMMTKYWALTVIGAVGLAALLHPERLRFLASPAPWVAIVIFVIGMIPHVWWLVQVDFVPLTYAGTAYHLTSYASAAQLAANYVSHNVALLVPALLALLIALRWQPIRRLWRQPLGATLRTAVLWSRERAAKIDLGQARNVWIIQAVIAVVPPVAAVVLLVYMKTDWGIPLFFLTPLAVMALPQLGVQRIALSRLAVIWLAMTLGALIASPLIAQHSVRQVAEVGSTSTPTSQFAQQLTDAWHQRFHSHWPVVAATTEIGQPLTFYSPDHPAPLTPDELWASGLTSLAEAKRFGFIGVCDTTDGRVAACEAWMTKNAPNAERLNMTSRRFFHGISGPTVQWRVYIVPPEN